MQIGDDVAIDLIGIAAAVAKTHDIEADRCQQFQFAGLADLLLQLLGQLTGMRNHVAEFFGAIHFDGEPGFEGAKAA